MKKWIYLFLLVSSFALKSFGQIQTRFFPQGQSSRVFHEIPNSISQKTHKAIAELDRKIVARKDSAESASGIGRAPRFGKSYDVNVNLLNEGSVYKTGDSTYLIYQINAKKAKSINLLFNRFVLDNKTSVIIYNTEKTMLYGPITAQQNPDNGILLTDVIIGERIIIKVSTLGDFEKDNELHLSEIIYGYKEVGLQKDGSKIYVGGGAALCEVNTKCIDGVLWHEEERAVAMILVQDPVDGWYRWCSGTLLNNASGDFTPNFLTAFHCLDLNANLTLESSEIAASNNWAFRFLYVAAGCAYAEPEGLNYITFNGSSFRAAHSQSDFALLLMNTRPNGINYAGWSRSGTAPTSGVVIHHPMGDVKKISIPNQITNLATDTSFPTGEFLLANKYWKTTYSKGLTEKGSSGGPLFNQNHQVVGQLYGGVSSTSPSPNCLPSGTDYYGRFDVSWVGGGTASTRLRDWLDPSNTVTSVNTICGGISGPAVICTSGQFTPNYSGIIWSSNSAGLSINSNGLATRQNNFIGSVTITATLTEGCVASKTVWVGSPMADNSTLIYPNGYRGVDPVTLASNSVYQFICDYVPGATSYTWVVPSGFSLQGAKTSSTPGIRTSSIDDSYTINCSANNACGSGWTHSLGINIGSGGGGQQQRIAVYPNPAQQDLIIEYVPKQPDLSEALPSGSSTLQKIQENFFAKLFNGFNQEIKSGTSSNGRLILNTQDLKDGLYYLHVKDMQGLITMQIQIKK